MSALRLNGDPASVAVDRGGFELRGGRALHLVGTRARWCLVCVENLGPAMLERLQRHAPDGATLFLTDNRARALDLAPGAVGIRSRTPWTLPVLHALAGLSGSSRPDLTNLELAPAPPELEAGFLLARRTRLVPALLGVPVGGAEVGILEVRAEDIQRLAPQHGVALMRLGEARVPLADHEDCRFVLFRDEQAANDHLAVILGDPAGLDPVPVRLHSSCLTGDLLGSLRCDCGEQLRAAVRAIAAAGGGVLLYLSQEGRGIGLANKLRAYGLQDEGLDTIEADNHLGFCADERDFECAASMLKSLGVQRVELYTNNPHKVDELRAAGIDVLGRRPLVASINAHNARYIQTKRDRAGHL